jgi:hypothetical protein
MDSLWNTKEALGQIDDNGNNGNQDEGGPGQHNWGNTNDGNDKISGFNVGDIAIFPGFRSDRQHLIGCHTILDVCNNEKRW